MTEITQISHEYPFPTGPQLANGDEQLFKAAWDHASVRGRGIGTMFLAGFGSLWLAAGLWDALQNGWIVGAVAVAGSLLFLAGRNHYRRHALYALPSDLQTRFDALRAKGQRMFHLVNVLQWVSIIAVNSYLNYIGKSAWSVAAVMLIVGLHFLPLARLFRSVSHAIVGGIIILLAVSYPFVAAGGPQSPLGPIVMGLILWGSAAGMLAGAKRTLAQR